MLAILFIKHCVDMAGFYPVGRGGGGGGEKLPPSPQTFQLPPPKDFVTVIFPRCTDTFSLEVKYQNSSMKLVYYVSL